VDASGRRAGYGCVSGLAVRQDHGSGKSAQVWQSHPWFGYTSIGAGRFHVLLGLSLVIAILHNAVAMSLLVVLMALGFRLRKTAGSL